MGGGVGITGCGTLDALIMVCCGVHCGWYGVCCGVFCGVYCGVIVFVCRVYVCFLSCTVMACVCLTHTHKHKHRQLGDVALFALQLPLVGG